MSTCETNQHPSHALPHNRPAAATWSSGADAYDEISRQISDAIEHAVDRLDPRPGQHILDVATGTGWAARRVAASDARVTGVDFGSDMIAAAERLDPSGRIAFQVGDAERLPFPDASFDGVISTFGVMFCAEPAKAAAELARVCKPGGRLALTTWATTGFVRQMFLLLHGYRPDKPPAGSSCPFAWGDTNRVTELLGEYFNLGFEEAVSYYRERDGTAAWQAFSRGFGPVVTLSEKLDAATLDQLRVEFEELHERYRTGAGLLVERPYVVTVGERLAQT